MHAAPARDEWPKTTRTTASKRAGARKTGKTASGAKKTARTTGAKKSAGKRKTAAKSGAKRKTAAKRETIDTGTDKRYVRRGRAGQFKESDDVSRSLSTDARKKAKTKVKPGQGDRGDR